MQRRFSVKGSGGLSDKTREELITLRGKFEKREEEVRGELTRIEQKIQSEDRQRFALAKATAVTSQQSRNILREEVNKALQFSEEYNYPFFGPYLLQAIEKENIIRIRLLGRKIEVSIRMDAAAGRLANYGVAVDKARKELGVGKKISAAAASHIWRWFIYAAGREGKTTYPAKRKNRESGEEERIEREIPKKYLDAYVRTMEMRLSFLGENAKASWWELLDKGNAKVIELHSRGGTPFPALGATNFKAQSESRILILVQEEYQRQLARYTNVFRKRADRLEKVLDSILKSIRRIEDLLQGREERDKRELFEQRRLLALDLLKQQLEEANKLKLADMRKVEELARRLAQGEDVDRIRVGGGARPRTLDILNQLELEFGKW